MKKFLLPLLLILLPAAAGAQRVDPVYIDDRFNQLQQSLTMLTGQIEQLQYRNQQLQQQLEKMQADYEFRLEQMEKGGKGGAAPAPRPTPGPGAAPAPLPPASQGNLAANTPGAAGNNVDALYHDAFKMMQDGDYVGAERGFKTFIQRNPQHQLAGNAQYWLGESYYSRGDFQNAMTAFAEGYKSYKTGPKGPDNLLKLGVTLAKLNRKGDACAMFQRFNQDYPRANDLQKRRIEQERQRNGC